MSGGVPVELPGAGVPVALPTVDPVPQPGRVDPLAVLDPGVVDCPELAVDDCPCVGEGMLVDWPGVGAGAGPMPPPSEPPRLAAPPVPLPPACPAAGTAGTTASALCEGKAGAAREEEARHHDGQTMSLQLHFDLLVLLPTDQRLHASAVPEKGAQDAFRYSPSATSNDLRHRSIAEHAMVQQARALYAASLFCRAAFRLPFRRAGRSPCKLRRSASIKSITLPLSSAGFGASILWPAALRFTSFRNSSS